MPYATIIVPAYNAAATLPATLASLSAQTFRDFEVVIIDDGSIDDTALIASIHAASDSRFRLLHQFNRGLAGARNSGIAEAQGEVIGFCDADDLWMPEKLATHVDHLLGKPEVGISYSGSAMIDEAGQRIGHAQRPRLYDVSPAHVFKRNPIGNGSAPVIRREALAEIAWRPASEMKRDWIFDETFRQSEDIECWMRLCLCTDWIIAGVPGLLTEYRVNSTGLSANVDAQLASWERMVSKLRPTASEFFARYEAAARAYQLRYLARRAVSSGDGETACTLIARAYRESARPIFEEPLRSVSTLLAAHATARFGDLPMTLARSVLRAARA
ncbi:UDP-Glc:alpha-D-GlcNAc-diphosphoundecaprenol beta-1,3-glucosyltransferase WfgD [Roseovarius sp. THAF9]|uniref:glycosyltransferase family 2 protein n=1 Tax=Roseovarius sp. THAF9 TaxID=2587847 RepID=UPI0012698723|nr:glycosyltransferase family A protein [Roseovarius sp. THAF9]QFT93996.1 UDP-Glc:alpha-D-GlcNAc-diphosphoundecaprenol beta-1,3-glucosyltransferase WfgD [Roseovarius sp. THAF9]